MGRLLLSDPPFGPIMAASGLEVTSDEELCLPVVIPYFVMTRKRRFQRERDCSDTMKKFG